MDQRAEELLRLEEQLRGKHMDESAREQALLRFADKTMSASQQEKMRSVLQDRKALQALMQSEKAQALLERLQKRT